MAMLLPYMCLQEQRRAKATPPSLEAPFPNPYCMPSTYSTLPKCAFTYSIYFSSLPRIPHHPALIPHHHPLASRLNINLKKKLSQHTIHLSGL